MKKYKAILENYDSWVESASDAPVQLEGYPSVTMKTVWHGLWPTSSHLEIRLNDSPVGRIYRSGTVSFLGLDTSEDEEANNLRRDMGIHAPIKIKIDSDQEAYAFRIVVEGEARYIKPSGMVALWMPASYSLSHEGFHSLIELPLALSSTKSVNLWDGALYLIDQSDNEIKINPNSAHIHPRNPSP